ncbi:sensor histidine kinase [Terribacillus saccharophilus]|uniref:histidine kinase n=1 Tax=Terribacillus saccharophilus TaxID=361277 RepID=A0ABX4GWV4_9BACI|nr:sensor histidine kinase [Terribacillus saccharophilus]PAD35075.1 two-component sensor histidine kinase [Terribacillus saccharophilus]PAD95787.1 two-component sensor histidine kinase [Terribacillus saccharophilus]PAD99355.1 two-component sensor histidine kinase [Terribacillus saccharophilus]
MAFLFLFLFLLSLVLNVILFKSKRKVLTDLTYIEDKLNHIADTNGNERILLHTDVKQVQSLLIKLNLLLDRRHQVAADYTNIERSMRKMLSNISHDLKTPLTVILGYIEIAENEKDLSEEKLVGMLHTLKIKSAEVLDLINRFFELAKLESGDKELELGKLDICELSRKVILDFSSILQNEAFDIAIDIPEFPIHVMGNEEAIIRVLNNLVSNAISYGFEGKLIGLKLSKTEGTAYIEVYDKGRGISESQQDHVFERMYTMEDSRNKQYQGSGLGLTITKRLVEQMDGSISLQSTPYVKTSFKIGFKCMN